MNSYIVVSKIGGGEVYRYKAEAPIEFAGMEFTICNHNRVDEAMVSNPSVRRLTKLEFIDKLGDSAFSAILQLAKASPIIEAWVEKIKLATPDPDMTSVNLDDPRTIAGVEAIGGILEAQGIVATGWASEVLNG